MGRWDRACAVTGCRVPEVLRASHIKPWGISNNRERRDPANGLLLSANIDALFDAGLVSFDARGKMIVSSLLSTDERKRLRVPRNLTRSPDETEQSYLAVHRQSRFKA
jgi:predicted restriction endonuclease